jgi:hypothetical protein
MELEWMKYQKTLPEKQAKTIKEETIRSDILTVIENKVLLKAINSEALPPHIKLSIDRTTLRLQSMRTLDEIVGFFNGALRSDRGRIVQEALHNEGLLGFEDIKDEINDVYKKSNVR